MQDRGCQRLQICGVGEGPLLADCSRSDVGGAGVGGAHSLVFGGGVQANETAPPVTQEGLCAPAVFAISCAAVQLDSA